jgi:hypothetical protein
VLTGESMPAAKSAHTARTWGARGRRR